MQSALAVPMKCFTVLSSRMVGLVIHVVACYSAWRVLLLIQRDYMMYCYTTSKDSLGLPQSWGGPMLHATGLMLMIWWSWIANRHSLPIRGIGSLTMLTLSHGMPHMRFIELKTCLWNLILFKTGSSQYSNICLGEWLFCHHMILALALRKIDNLQTLQWEQV